MKGDKIFRGLLVFVLVFVGVGVFFEGSLVSGLIWKPSDMNNCSSSDILAVWDNVFVTSSGGIEILKEFTAVENDCVNFLAWKNDSNGGFWAVFGFFSKDKWEGVETSYDGDKKILNFSQINFYYANVSLDFINDFKNGGDILSKINGIDFIGSDVFDWDVESEDDFKNKFSNYFSFTDFSGLDFDYISSNYTFINEDSTDLDYSMLYVGGPNDKSFLNSYYIEKNYELGLGFSGEFDNFSFYMNSGWNEAFDLRDYFTYPVGTVFEVVPIETNNANGELIGFRINNDVVEFEAVDNYKGTRSFKVQGTYDGDSVVSDVFRVSIVNNPPKYNNGLGVVYIPKDGEVVVNLDFYFSDEDDEDLTYSIKGGDNLTKSLDNEILTLAFKPEKKYANFEVVASDGEDDVSSGNVLVFIKSASSGSGDVGSNAVYNNINGSLNDSSGGNSSENRGNSESGDSWIMWVIIVILGLVFLCCIVFVVYFIFSKKDYEKVNEVNEVNRNTKVANYLKELNKKEEKVEPVKENTSSFVEYENI